VSIPVLTAVTDRWESALVSGLAQVRDDVSVVRRCVDLADLLATATTGQARAALVSADLRRLDGEALSRLDVSGLAIVGLVAPGDEAAERRLCQLGVSEVLVADTAAVEVVAAVRRAVAAHEAHASVATEWGDPARALDSDPTHDATTSPGAPAEQPSGRLLAVWGPTGAPGRTAVAVTLAAELAALGHDTVLADADTYGGSVAQVLGVLDEAPGLAAAVRAADLGSLDRDQLSRFAPALGPHLRVLTGIVRAERWPELRAGALAKVLTLCRSLADWTVVDCGFGLEQDEEIAYDTVAPRRNGATLTVLDRADLVVAVGAAEPVGLQRLVRGLGDLAEARPAGRPLVVVNRVRGSAVGGSPRARIRQALDRYASVEDPVLVPDDRAAFDAALLAGRSITEAAPRSPARRALAELAQRLADDQSATRERSRRRTRR
jgi:MinD-like ATPase involved in chromosome partitioning or flagellar assembly